MTTTASPTPRVKEYSLGPEFIQEFGFVIARVVNGCLILRHNQVVKLDASLMAKTFLG
jgi:hypothetical protein